MTNKTVYIYFGLRDHEHLHNQTHPCANLIAKSNVKILKSDTVFKS